MESDSESTLPLTAGTVEDDVQCDSEATLPLSKPLLTDSDATLLLSDTDETEGPSSPLSPPVLFLNDLDEERQSTFVESSPEPSERNIQATAPHRKSPILLSDDSNDTRVSEPAARSLCQDVPGKADEPGVADTLVGNSPGRTRISIDVEETGTGRRHGEIGTGRAELLDLTVDHEDQTVDDDVARVVAIFEEADPAAVRDKLQR